MMRVGILGGGITGLATAYRLSRIDDVDVTLFEASDRLGGVTTWFEHDGVRLDRFYHVLLDSDTHLIAMLDELGLGDDIRWTNTKMGFFVRDRQYPFNGAIDLLRFGALRFRDRIRTGLMALYITKGVRDPDALDLVPAHTWLRKLFGQRVYDCLWDPLLAAKFGDLRLRVPAYWIWNTLNREKDGSEEVKGYVRGGYVAIATRLARQIEAQGGSVRINSPVEGVHAEGRGVQLTVGGQTHQFDAVFSTLPLPLLQKLAVGSFAQNVPLPDLAYQGVVNVVLILRQPLDKYYWTAVVDSDFDFQGVVETTHVIDPAWIGNRHLVYLRNYCSADSPLYNLSDATLKQQAIEGLCHLYPNFDADNVEAIYVFRTPHVEPVWPLGYTHRRPAYRIGHSDVYLATTAQAYPMVTSWNTSIKLARDAIDCFLADRQRRESHVVPNAVNPQPARSDTETEATGGRTVPEGRATP